MKKYPIDRLRNIGLIGHGGSGKTSLAEALLFDAGAIDRLGKTEDGNTTMDYDPEEIRRGITINSSIAPAEWKDHKINIIDTPGYFDFVGEVKAGLRVVDAAISVIDAVSGVEVGTELTWRYADEYHLPRLLFVNKMERENANFEQAVESAIQMFGNNIVPVQLPIGAEAKFRGVVDLVGMRAYTFDATGKKVEEGDIPADLAGKAAEYRTKLIEAAAETDDALLEKYLEGNELTADEVRTGLAKGVRAGKIVPVCCGSAGKNIGIQPLLDVIINNLPSPADRGEATGVNPKSKAEEKRQPADNAPFSALVFKTMADPYVGKLTIFRVYSGTLKSDSHAYNANKGRDERIGQLLLIKGKTQEPVAEVSAGDLCAVAKLQETTTNETLCDEANPIMFAPATFPHPVYHVAVMPKSKGDEDKIGSGLARLAEEDPTFSFRKDPVTMQTVISGMGDQHLEIITDRLKRKFGTDVTLEMPKVAFKETIRAKVQAEHKHKKQTGGRGQYGHVIIEMEPMPEGEFEFVDKVFGGAVPRNFIPAVEKGMREAILKGVLAGYPVTHLRIALLDGSYHPVDSSEMAFKIASHQAFKKGMQSAKPVLLEPIYSVEVRIPQEYMGDVIGDLNKKRGKVLGMDAQGNFQVVKALVPLAEMARYAIDLRSITQGRGTFTMDFSGYEEVPANVAQAVIEAAAKDKKEEEEE
ncbi:MAG: elongation factor G [Chloroflexota bacterium]